jgi:hypothetical protein
MIPHPRAGKACAEWEVEKRGRQLPPAMNFPIFRLDEQELAGKSGERCGNISI